MQLEYTKERKVTKVEIKKKEEHQENKTVASIACSDTSYRARTSTPQRVENASMVLIFTSVCVFVCLFVYDSIAHLQNPVISN